jgi:ABC-type antimicrobial peptide transport system permease subunit
MLKNYLKIAVRNLLKHKGYSSINILGLAVGLASCLLITLWIIDELSYDTFHKKSNTLYHVITPKGNASTPAPLGPVLEEECPEVIYATRYSGLLEVLLSHKDKRFYEDNIVGVDPAFFKMFSFTFLKGDAENSLSDLQSMVISENIAKKYFGNQDPIGKTITMNHQREFTISGVIKNTSHNSTLQFDIIVPFEIRIENSKEQGFYIDNWGTYSPNTFILTQEDVDEEEVNAKITAIIRNYAEKDAELVILPFADRNLFFSEKEKYLKIFSVVALFILLIACINFMNLSTARSANRATEIGIRKVTGAYQRTIFVQFMLESFFLALFAVIIAIGLVEFFLPVFNTGLEMNLSLSTLNPYSLLSILLGMAIITGFAAGSYPALYLSSFRPIKVLQGKLRAGTKSTSFRKILVVIQFSLSIFLIIGTGVVYKQLEFIKHKDIGYQKEHILNVSLRGECKKYYDVLKNELISHENIRGISGTMDDMPYFGWKSIVDWEGKDPNQKIYAAFNFIDYDFIKTFKISLIEGRDFSKKISSDRKTSFLINEEMVKILEKEYALGTRIKFFKNYGTVIGVMKNFNHLPLDYKTIPVILMLDPQKVLYMSIRMRPDNISTTLSTIEDTWKKIIPSFPFEYQFLDHAFDRRYRSTERMGNLANSFALLAVFIACLGLFGLASFTAEQRSKEIGIRKVFGATGISIVYLMSKEFTRWVLAANIIAWPVAWFIMEKWLESYAYRTDIGGWIFIITGGIALLIALVTVSTQAIKAALINPIEALRYE